MISHHDLQRGCPTYAVRPSQQLLGADTDEDAVDPHQRLGSISDVEIRGSYLTHYLEKGIDSGHWRVSFPERAVTMNRIGK
jgi:hypothetical protein